MTASRASFRDPDGSVFLTEDRVLRVVTPGASAALGAALESQAVRRLVDTGQIVASEPLSETTAVAVLEQAGLAPHPPGSLVLAHPRVAFPTFAHEWCPEMLHAAARLTLDVALALHKGGFGLKDATPHNILFQSSRPTLIDVASVEKRDAGVPTWLPHAQFSRTFLLPLLVNRHCGLSLQQIFLAHREGIEPEAAYGLLGPGRRLLPSFFLGVTLPVWLSRRAEARPSAIYAPRREPPDKAAFILESTLSHLGRQLKAAGPVASTSTWSNYMETKSYEGEAFGAKEAFVQAALESGKPRRVLDIGCNTGHFSELSARNGAQVVALDSDAACVGHTYRRAVAGSLSILPVVADIARPSPALGWRNAEQASLISRLKGRFDLVLMLAVLHHLLVTERVPLAEVLDLTAELTTDAAVIEFVGSSDPMFQKLVRGRQDLYKHMTASWFEEACAAKFEVVQRRDLGNADRRLYLLRKRA